MIYTNINEIQGEYNLILADPPWSINKTKRRTRPSATGGGLDYPTLSLIDIKQHLSIITNHTTSNAIMFLWTIEHYLKDALDLLDTLGWKKHIVMIWDKSRGAAPAFSVRFVHEYLIYAYKGKFERPIKEMQGKYGSVFHELSYKHSKKPEVSYEIIESLYPEYYGHRIEMYARSIRSGWDSFGNELENVGGEENENQIKSETS